MSDFSLDTYDFFLPDELIAQSRVPLEDERLLSVGRDGTIDDNTFLQWIETLDHTSVLIFNDSKVVKARIPLHDVVCVSPTGESVLLDLGEIFVYEILDVQHAEVLVSDGKHFRPGWTIKLASDLHVVSESFVEDGILMRVVGDSGNDSWRDVMETYGEMPLPPYIQHDTLGKNVDSYQTDYAGEQGSVAAPTAGLRFSQEVLSRLEEKGIEYAFVTLHVGLGTFKPLYKGDVRDHVLHRESVSISSGFLKQLGLRKKNHKKIVAVGTTVCRVLETLPYLPLADMHGGVGDWIQSYTKEDTHGFVSNVRIEEHKILFHTQLFVYPGFALHIIGGLLTNFHLPKTSLLLLVSTILGGSERLMSVYQHAIEERYRFYSFGDCMYLDKK